MKEKRHAEILRIITEQPVDTQEQLLALLEQEGIRTTQATLSRDFKELHLVKEPMGEGEHRYVQVPGHRTQRNQSGRMRNIFKEGVTSFEAAQNIIVVKTMPGLAGAVGVALDDMGVGGLAGSLAGDDTVLMVMRTNRDAEAFLETIQSMFK